MSITRNTLMHYSLLGDDSALTQAEVRKVVHLYLEEHFCDNQQFVPWPKDIKEMCSSLGIVQSRETGFPSDETGVHVAKELQRTFIKEENEMLRRENHRLSDALDKMKYQEHGTEGFIWESPATIKNHEPQLVRYEEQENVAK